jgi:hypothetical protein
MRLRAAVVRVALLALIASPLQAQTADPSPVLFFQAASPDEGTSEDALEEIGKHWKNGYAALLLEWVRFLPSGERGDNARGWVLAAGRSPMTPSSPTGTTRACRRASAS